ncbi:MAG: S-methyl-5-thioribose-1-phosphate isomerase [Bacteroides sp.]|nr:S-methyl-5-thioribose-1-phosphate isomerase [Bacteroides sp.]
MGKGNNFLFENVRLSDDAESAVIIDQTRLPNEEVRLKLKTPEDFYRAIKTLQVRGAPAIGICAGFGLAVSAKGLSRETRSEEEFFTMVRVVRERLDSARPTAVNLSRALERVENAALSEAGRGIDAIVEAMLRESREIQLEDAEMCRRISEYGLSLVKSGSGILTHCNAGPLATSAYGTGLGTLFLGKERGYEFHVYVDETRPLLQGARLTAYELNRAGIDVTVICDNMASIVMKQGKIDACFVGCDRMAANGDTANKIGTSGVAVLARHYNIPFYVFCPSSTIDFNCASGEEIVIEERSEEEIRSLYFEKPAVPEGVKCYNPAFDVTDNSLITAVVTERGICRAPFKDSLGALFNRPVR